MNGLITSRHGKNAVITTMKLMIPMMILVHFDDVASYDSGSSDSPLYGGLPYGDGELFIVDHEDLIDQMDF